MSIRYEPSRSWRENAYLTPSTMLLRLGGSASGGGGGVRMSVKAVSEAAKEATSIAYAVFTPAAAMTTPASPGPAISATFESDQLMALAALSSSRSTSLDMSASSGGLSTALAHANSAAAT